MYNNAFIFTTIYFYSVIYFANNNRYSSLNARNGQIKPTFHWTYSLHFQSPITYSVLQHYPFGYLYLGWKSRITNITINAAPTEDHLLKLLIDLINLIKKIPIKIISNQWWKKNLKTHFRKKRNSERKLTS